ncbi:MAG: anti-phage BREX system Lon protease BrxL, partial [Aquificaceae bacterium]
MKKTLDYFDEKIRSVFQEESVYKDDSVRSIFECRKLPSFIKDWLIKKFSEGDKINKEGILAFLERHMPVGDIK